MANDIFCKSGSGVVAYINSHTWILGDKVVPTVSSVASNVANGRMAVWECTTAGTTTGEAWPASAPTYDSTTITQNGVVFTARKPGYSSGSTVDWTFATPYLHYLAAALTNLGTAYRGLVSNNHAESQGVSISIIWPGTIDLPTIIECVDDSVTSSFTSATTATCTTTSSTTWTLSGIFRTYGISFFNGTGASSNAFILNNSTGGQMAVMEKGSIQFPGSGNLSTLALTSTTTNSAAYTRFIDIDLKFGSTSGCVRINRTNFDWRGGSILSGTTTPTSLFRFNANAAGGSAFVDNVDLSNLGTGFSFCDSAPSSNGELVVTRCKLPSGWTGGALTATTSAPGFAVEIDDCDSGATNYIKWRETAFGSYRQSTNVCLTGGATDGTTQKSWVMNSNANASGRFFGISTKDSPYWNESTGSSLTATVELISNTASLLTNAEFNLTLTYHGVSGNPLGSAVSSRPATPQTTATNLSTSTTLAWDSLTTARANSTAYALGDAIKLASNANRVFFCTTAGTSAGSEPGGYSTAIDGGSVTDGTAVFRAGRRQHVAVPFTPQLKGLILWHVTLTKPSTTVYVDRKITVA